MQHKLFGKLTYRHADEVWDGRADLPILATLTVRKGQRKSAPAGCPIHIEDPAKKRPSPEQEAAFAHLIKNEKETAALVLGELFASYKQYYADEHWRKICHLPDITRPEELAAIADLIEIQFSRAQRNGTAYLIFNISCDWEQEHGCTPPTDFS